MEPYYPSEAAEPNGSCSCSKKKNPKDFIIGGLIFLLLLGLVLSVYKGIFYGNK